MSFCNCLAFSMIQQMLTIWSMILLPFLDLACASESSQFTYYWSLLSLKDFEHYLASIWNECNCMVVWTLFRFALLCGWSENWNFSVLWSLLSFPNLLAYWVQHFHSIILVVGDSIPLSSNFKCCRREAWCFSFIDYLLFAGFSPFLGFQSYFQDIYVFYFSYNMPKTL